MSIVTLPTFVSLATGSASRPGTFYKLLMSQRNKTDAVAQSSVTGSERRQPFSQSLTQMDQELARLGGAQSVAICEPTTPAITHKP